MNKRVIIEDKLIYFENTFNTNESEYYFERLLRTINWTQDEITIFGKKQLIPRLSSWHGDEGANYSYSGLELVPNLWTEELLQIKSRIESVSRSIYNSALLNYYRSGKDSMGWHSDDEKEIERNSTIASVTFGAQRRFLIREKANKKEKQELILANGSLLLMMNDFQNQYQHSIPKTAKPIGERINITLRKIDIKQ